MSHTLTIFKSKIHIKTWVEGTLHLKTGSSQRNKTIDLKLENSYANGLKRRETKLSEIKDQKRWLNRYLKVS